MEHGDKRIRAATLADVDALARLHVAVWRETYRHLAPAEAIAALDEGARRALWARILATDEARQLYLVAEAGAEPVAFGGVSPAAHAIFADRAEIKLLYVRSDHQRLGIGRRLIRRLAQHAVEHGFPGVGLAVVEGNDPAIRFYQALGGKPGAKIIDPGPIWKSQNRTFVWDDERLRALAAD